jgi:hypothetical protein
MVAHVKVNGGSCESHMLSHNNMKMAWLLQKTAWSCLHLVQLHNFLTSNILTFAKWQDFKNGHFLLFHVQQLSYMVLDVDL